VELVIIESPYAGNVELNLKYAKMCVLDCLKRNEAPYASHLFFTQPDILDDTIPEERDLGIKAGLCWGEKAEKTVVYHDLGITPGMDRGIKRAMELNRPIEYRTLPKIQIRNLLYEK
jgi:hypothetical protein